MQHFMFNNLELFFTPISLFLIFIFTFIKNFSYTTSLTIYSPNFLKKNKNVTNNYKPTAEHTQILLSVLIINLLTNIDKNNIFYSDFIKVKWLPFIVLLLILFFKIIKLTSETFYQNNINFQKNWFSTHSFLLLFIPATFWILNSSSFLDLILPFELFSFLFYFIFLEYTIIKNKNNKFQKILRSLMYYYWLSFLGSVFFLISIFIVLSVLPSTSFYLLTKAYLQINSNIWLSIVFPVLFLIAFFTKMGSLFFFFFKTNLYKTISINGLLVLSVFTSFFYFFILYFLVFKIPFLMYFTKLTILPLFSIFFIWLVIFFNLQFSNFYLFIGLSSVLTTVFCIFLFI